MSDKPSIRQTLEFYGALVVPEGSRWRALRCPFHEDTHASATVNTEKESFRCFVCDISGDAYTVVMLKEGVDFVGAKQFLEERVGTSGEEVRGPAAVGRARWGVPASPGAEPGQRSLLDVRPRWRTGDA